MKLAPQRLLLGAAMAFCMALMAACTKNPDGSITIGLPTSTRDIKALLQDPSLIHPGTYHGPGTLELKQAGTGKYSIDINIAPKGNLPSLRFTGVGYQDKNEIYFGDNLVAHDDPNQRLIMSNVTDILRQVSPTAVEFIHHGEKARVHTNVNPRFPELFGV